MKLFSHKKPAVPIISVEKYEPVLRCSICNGEQVLCFRDRKSGELQEIMLIRDPSVLERFCSENGIAISEIEKIY